MARNSIGMTSQGGVPMSRNSVSMTSSPGGVPMSRNSVSMTSSGGAVVTRNSVGMTSSPGGVVMSPGDVIADGSWELTVFITEVEVEKTLRVRGDMHIGGLMLRLVDGLDLQIDWSDYGLWWPERSLWLLRTRSTLDQYGVQADVHLQFIPMHRPVRIQLPDLQYIEQRVNFSANVFAVVIKLCKDLGIRHPEELSLCRRLDREELKRNQGVSATRRSRPAGLRSSSSSGGGGGGHHTSNTSLLVDGGSTFFGGRSSGIETATSPRHRFTPLRGTPRGGGSLIRTCSTPISPYGPGGMSCPRSPYSPYVFNANSSLTPGSVNSLFFGTVPLDSALSNSPSLPTSEAMLMLYRPKNLAEKARINAGWFDSSRSLQEQGVTEQHTILLRYKFYAFYDLNPKYDQTRINQIYEQAKWSILSEELDCTQEEVLMFAALQIQIQSQMPQSSDILNGTGRGSCIKDEDEEEEEDQIDAALNELQMALDGTTTTSSPAMTLSRGGGTGGGGGGGGGDITRTPELSEYLRYFKPKKFWPRTARRQYFVFRDTCLHMYASAEDTKKSSVARWTINLKGCDVTPDVLVTSSRYNIKIFVPSRDGVNEFWLRADSEEQYANWMAAIRLACKGKTMADSSYSSEVKSIVSLLSMQHRATPTGPPSGLQSGSALNIQPQDYIPARFVKKIRSKQLVQRILEAHSNVHELRLTDAKLTYIRAWQALPDHGFTYFIVKFKGSKKEELVGVTHNRIVRLDPATGECHKSWPLQSMKSWSVNWDIKQVLVSFEDEDLAFHCLTADCKVVHEFIGGYIFLSMRSGDRSQTLNEELFHKLTGGWI